MKSRILKIWSKVFSIFANFSFTPLNGDLWLNNERPLRLFYFLRYSVNLRRLTCTSRSLRTVLHKFDFLPKKKKQINKLKRKNLPDKIFNEAINSKKGVVTVQIINVRFQTGQSRFLGVPFSVLLSVVQRGLGRFRRRQQHS